MSKKITLSSLVMVSTLLISSCSTPLKPSFYHAKQGKLSVSSPIVDQEMRRCSAELQQQPQQVKLGAPAILAASIPVIETTDIVKGIVKGSNILKAAVVAKTIKKSHDDIFSCMQKKGWKSVK